MERTTGRAAVILKIVIIFDFYTLVKTNPCIVYVFVFFLFPQSGKSSSPPRVTLSGVYGFLSYEDVLAAMESFGKTESVVLYRSRKEVGTMRRKLYIFMFFDPP